MTTKSAFLTELISRGFMHQATNLDGLDSLASQQPISAYIGFDCTADSLHVGSLIQIMMLRLLQKHGHKPIVLMGEEQQRLVTLLAKMKPARCCLTRILKRTRPVSAAYLKNI